MADTHLRNLISRCKLAEDRVSALHKRKELTAYDYVLAELRLIRREIFGVRQELEAWQLTQRRQTDNS